jgi:hypothetical protein
MDGASLAGTPEYPRRASFPFFTGHQIAGIDFDDPPFQHLT